MSFTRPRAGRMQTPTSVPRRFTVRRWHGIQILPRLRRRSRADFQRAQELDPRDAEIPANIGATYAKLRLWKEAERAALRALGIDPQNTVAAVSLLLTRLSATADVESARRALDSFPEAIESLTLLGRSGAGSGADVVFIVGIRFYLDVIQRHFTDALKALDKEVVNDDR